MFIKIIKKIEADKKFAFFALAVLFLVILSFNNQFWQNVFIGILFSIFYFLIISIWLGGILSKILNLEKEFQFLFGLFFLLYLIAFGLAVPIVFYKVSVIYFYIFLFFLTGVISFFNHYFQKKYQSTNQDVNLQTANKEEGIKIHLIFYFLFSIFYLLAWFLLFKARTGESLISPWQVISPIYLYLCFGLFFLTILFIFSKKKIIIILFFIILISLLVHAYLPVVHENNWGVDKWRHLGAERRLLTGQVESPALFGEELKYKKIGPLTIPEVFVVGNKTSYATSWGLTIALSWLTGIDIFWIDMFLVFVLWSLFLPIFAFKLTYQIFENKNLSLLTAFSTLIPHAFQTDGAITLPKTVGFLFFIFFLTVFFSYLKNKKGLLPLIIFFFVLLYFNYILFLILSLEIFIFGLILKNYWQNRKTAKVIVLVTLFIIFSLSLVLLDRVSGVTFFQYKISEISEIFLFQLEKFWQKLMEGKYFYYQGKLPTNVSFLSFNLFFTPLALVLIIYSIFSHRKNYFFQLLAIFLFITLINQFLSESFMKNYRLLARRSSMVIIFLLALLFSTGLIKLMEKVKLNFKSKVIILSLFLALFTTATYASGPYYLGTVTRDELGVAKYLDREIKKEPAKKFCVLDAGWRLLALESVNGMIAGNFPTHPVDFVQREKDELYRQMLKNPSKELLEKTFEITGANKCFFLIDINRLKPENFDKIKEILGEPVVVSDVYIWRYVPLDLIKIKNEI